MAYQIPTRQPLLKNTSLPTTIHEMHPGRSCLRICSPQTAHGCASAHLAMNQPQSRIFSGRSRFLVFMRLPAGREATLAYIQKLRSLDEPPIITDASAAALLNLSLPQVPPRTEVGLVRQAILVDTDGKLTPTPLTESVQFRVYRKITPGTPYMNLINGPSSHDQDFFEVRMSRPLLFAKRGGGLIAVRSGDKEHATFSTHGDDPFESGYGGKPEPILGRCRACHGNSGIQSVQSRVQWMKKCTSGAAAVDSDPISWETDATISRKRQQRDFQLLQRLWRKERE